MRTKTNQEKLSALDKLAESLIPMFQAGVLKKNIKNSLTNKGIEAPIAQYILNLAEEKALEFSFYKFK